MPKPSRETIAASPDEDFAVPRTRQIWIPDANHVKMAWNVVHSTKGLTPEDRVEARQRIIDRAKQFEMDTSRWESQRIESASIFTALSAMSLNVPTDAHPNKMPFSGILTRIGEPSDAAPEGSGGKRVMITAEAAEKNLGSLLGMGVNYNPNGHSPQEKVGFIDSATIEANAIHIGGFIYAADFPEVAKEIKANKDILGFSFEARDLFTTDSEADPVPIADCVFTGAAILLKDKAAYRSTSINAASAAEEEYFIMDEKTKIEIAELVAAGVAAAIKPMADTLAVQATELTKIKEDHVNAANHLAKVERHAAELEKAADHMDAAGLGGDPRNGHAAVARDMAADMRASAVRGVMPSSYSRFFAAADKTATETVDIDGIVKAAVEKTAGEFTKQIAEVKAAAEKTAAEQVAALAAAETKIADMKAAAERTAQEAAPVARKTLTTGNLAMLAKTGVELPAEGGKLDKDALNKALSAANIPTEKRFELKAALAQAGVLA